MDFSSEAFETQKRATSGSATRLGRVSAASHFQDQLFQFTCNVHPVHPTWDIKRPACEWNGVNCDERGNVVELMWAIRNLAGKPCWSSLPAMLQKIYLNGNHLSGSLPFEDLPGQLVELHASGNLFSGALDFTQLPPTMCSINLDRNQFDGEVNLSQLPNGLTILCLDYNQRLSGQISKEHLPKTLVHCSLLGTGIEWGDSHSSSMCTTM